MLIGVSMIELVAAVGRVEKWVGATIASFSLVWSDCDESFCTERVLRAHLPIAQPLGPLNSADLGPRSRSDLDLELKNTLL